MVHIGHIYNLHTVIIFVLFLKLLLNWTNGKFLNTIELILNQDNFFLNLLTYSTVYPTNAT